MTILVTGVSGFLGGTLLSILLNDEKINYKDIRVLLMENEDKKPFEKLGVNVFVGNLLDKKSLKGIMKDVNTVYHNAAIVINEACSRETMMKVNFEGTKELALEFLKEESTEKFVYASTFGVYGMKFPKKPVNEDYQINPANNYQESKYLAEKYLLELSHETSFNATAIRNSLILGPGDRVTSLRLSQGLLNHQIPYLGNGKNKLSLVDARDSSRAMILSSKKPISKGQAYNVKSFDVSQKEYFNYYAQACGNCYPNKKYPYWLAYLFAWFKESTTSKDKETLITRTRVNRYTNTRLLDTSKIEHDLGFEPEHTNAVEVIKESVDWLIKNKYIQI